jgi:hypothetical protein
MMGLLGASMACRLGLKGGTMKPDTYETTLAEVRVVPSPEGYYAYPTWWDGWIVVQYEPVRRMAGAYSTRIWRLRTDGGEFEMIDLPNHPSCGEDGPNGFGSSTTLPDGRLGYDVGCRPADDVWGSRTHLMAYDGGSGEVEQVLNYPVPSGSVGTGGYAWNPEMTRMIMGNARPYIDEQLYWFTRDGSEPLDVGVPLAYGPSWSPDGTQIAFIGSRAPGTPLVGSVHGVYLMKADGTDVQRLLEGFYDSAGLAFSPDGRWVAFPGRFGRREGEEQGLWVVDVETGERRLVAEGVFDAPRWSPDGQKIAVVQFVGPVETRRDQLVIIEVGPVLGD